MGSTSAGTAGQAAGVSADAPAQPVHRPSPLALLGWTGFVLLLVYAVMVGGGYGGIQSVTLRLLSLLVIAVVLAGWGLVAWRVPAWRPSTAIWPAIVIPIASLTLSLALSPFPRLGIEYLAWSILLAALYLLLVRILALEYTRARIGGLAALLGGVIGLLYLGIVVGRWLEWWDLVGRLAVPPLRPGLAGLPFGGPNLVASVVVLLTVMAFAGLGLTGSGQRVTLASLTAITLAVVIVSGSRSAWLGLAGAFVVVGGLWVVRERYRIKARLRDRRVRLSLGTGVASLLIMLVVLGPTLLDRLLNSGDGGRPSYFASAARMFEASPLVGLGPGTWAARRIAYLEPGELEYSVPHAHNIYIQTLAELGLTGLLAGLVAAAAVLWLVSRALQSQDATRHAWAWAVLTGTAYLAIVNVADFYANLPGLLVLWVMPVAMLDSGCDRGIGVPAALRSATASRLASAGLALGCLAAVLVLAWAESTALTSSRAVAAAEAGDWEQASVIAAQAVAADPGQPVHQLTLALAAMRRGDWESAREAYRQSVAVDDLPQAWLGLALATEEAGGPVDEIQGYLEAGLRMGSQHPIVSYGAAQIYDRLGETARADDAYVEALVRLPALAADPYWRSDPVMAGRFGALLDSAIERAGTAGWLLALMADDPERAREIAGVGTGTPAPGDSLTADVIAAWELDVDALARLQARVDDDPFDSGLAATAALLTAHAGDRDAADRLWRRAATVTEGPSIMGVEVHSVSDCADGTRVPLPSDLHGEFAYRRSTLRDLMPPGLRCLVLRAPPAPSASVPWRGRTRCS